ncbi:MAG TPA: hypothetical protein VE988_12550 [Gemmataceae bacterium]|nr:hypothetical protein [Gemmataceae bacterium]
MNRSFGLTVVGSLLMVAATWANPAPPPPPPVPEGHKIIDPHLCFEGIDDHKDYVFYVRCSFVGGRILEEVKAPKALKLAIKDVDRPTVNPQINNLFLLAMDRDQFNRRSKEDSSLEWLEESAQGVFSAKLTPPATTAPANLKDPPVTTYRVTLKDGKLSAQKIEDKKSSEGQQAGLLPMWAFGLVSSLSIAWLGIWAARRGAAATQSRT